MNAPVWGKRRKKPAICLSIGFNCFIFCIFTFHERDIAQNSF
jgi:hypothetical protein